MLKFQRKTFADSYLYNQESDKHNKNLTEFILKADRIDKNSDAFRLIAEDVKRQQNSSVLYTILMMDEVVLCINNVELPRAYKVFEARDLRTSTASSTKRKVFIDTTGIITLKDGYFYCKKIDVLITYLFTAMSYLLYNEYSLKLVNNSNISISGTECFVSMFNYIIDYLRIIGYSQNKEKISYLAGLYFLYHMMGKDLDTYSKNIAAKVAGVSTSDTRAFELYYQLSDFDNIYSFISLIAETFKLKGLTPEVFVAKWMYQYGTGTQYGTELFTSFSTILIYTYCGTYIINQKQIERCCGSSMVKFATAIMKMGVDVFENGVYREESELDSFVRRDPNTISLAESIFKRDQGNKVKISKNDYEDLKLFKEKVDSLIKYYEEIGKEEKISKKAVELTNSITSHMYSKFDKVNEGLLEYLLKKTKSYLSDDDKRKINNTINEYIELFNDDMSNYKAENKDEDAKFFTKRVIELRRCSQII